MENSRISWRRTGRALLPPAITLMIFMGVLFCKGIFPFGPNRIDYYDMGQTNVPLYYHIWDFLHGRSPLFYDWYINGGQNLSMGSAIQWNISPLNLFFLLIPRGMVLQSLSLFMGLRLFAMSLAMYCFLSSAMPGTGYRFRALFSISYGLCGYTLTHYTIPTYLDSAAFFPLLALSLFRLLRDGKPYFYALALGFTTALSYYLGFMHLIYILLFSGVWIFVYESPARDGLRSLTSAQRDRAAKLALSTAAGLGISAVMLLPAALQMSRSSRFRSNGRDGLRETLYSILQSIGADEYYVKGWQLFAMEAAFVLILFALVRCRRNWRENALLLSLFLIPCALIPFESINILWHLGTYYHYPIRCGYLIPFSLLTAANRSAGILFPEPPRTEARPRKLASLAVWMMAAVFSAALLLFYVNHPVWPVRDLFRLWTWLSAGFLLLYGGLLALSLLRPKALSFPSLLVPLVLSELVVGAFIGYGCPHFSDSFFGDPEQSGDYVETAEELMASLLQEDPGPLRRLKNPDTDLNTNYGMILRRGTVTGWANTITLPQQKAAQKLGYGTHFMRILDSGGTAFTDSLLGVTQILTRVPFSGPGPEYEEAGSAETSHGTFRLYESRTAFPSVLTVPSQMEVRLPGKGVESLSWAGLSGLLPDLSLCELQNILYQGLSGRETDILKDLGKGTKGEASRVISTEGNTALYLSGGQADEILVNGRPVPVPTIGDMENTSWPAWFNSSLLRLGSFRDETVTVTCPEASRLYLLDLDLLRELSDSLGQEARPAAPGTADAAEDPEPAEEPSVQGSRLTCAVRGTPDRDLALLPIHCDPGFRVRVNGEKRKALDILGFFTGIPLDPGENSIELSFTPPGLLPGALISLAALLALALSFLTGRKRDRLPCFESVKAWAGPVLVLIWAAAACFLYVIPVIWCVLHVIGKRLF